MEQLKNITVAQLLDRLAQQSNETPETIREKEAQLAELQQTPTTTTQTSQEEDIPISFRLNPANIKAFKHYRQEPELAQPEQASDPFQSHGGLAFEEDRDEEGDVNMGIWV